MEPMLSRASYWPRGTPTRPHEAERICLLECQQMPPLCADHCGSDCQTNVQHSWQNSPRASEQPWHKSHSFGKCIVCNSFPLDSKQLVFLLLQVLTIVPINCITMIIDNDANHPHRYHLHWLLMVLWLWLMRVSRPLHSHGIVMYYTLHCFLFALHSNDITLCYSKIIKHFIALNCFAFLTLIDCNTLRGLIWCNCIMCIVCTSMCKCAVC